MRALLVAAILGGLALGAPPLGAQTAAMATPVAATSPVEPTLGPETNLPLPRFVSLKTARGEARRGPSRSHRLDWVYTQRGLPLRVTGEFEHWRRVEDVEGQGGWVHYGQLSGVRTVLVTQDMEPMRGRPQANAPEIAYLEAGVVARIVECHRDWCRLNADGLRGWVSRTALWGLAPDEMLD